MGARRLDIAHAILRTLAHRTWFVEDEIRGLEELVRPGATCLDVGAEYGLYTQVLSHLAGASGEVHSVEPQPGAYRILRAGLSLSGAGNVHPHRLALGERAGRSALSVPRRRGLPVHGRAFLTAGANGLGANAEFTSSQEIGVEVRTLDEFHACHGLRGLDFLKADVEGAELSVLRGSERTLERHRPAILLEVEERHLTKYGTRGDEIVGWLRDRGYTAHRWSPRGWLPVAGITGEQRNYLFTVR